jgi:hypothetical protein
MKDFFHFVLIFISIEIILGIFYFIITPKQVKTKSLLDFRSLLKGIVERLFLMISLLNGYPHALTLFGALKLATRLKRNDDKDSQEKESLYNDFYLVGNFISVIVAILYVYLYKVYLKN